MIVTDEKQSPVMADAGTSQTQTQANTTEPSQPSPKKSATKVPPRRSGTLGIWLILLLLIVGLIGAGWYLWQEHVQQNQAITDLRTQLQQQERNLQTQQQSLSADIEQQLTQQDERVQNVVVELTQRLDNTTERVLSLSSVNRDDWKLAEAEYLLRLANQRVLLERNSGNAVALAKSVDEILRDLNDPDVFPVRKALASEIGELVVAGDIDREGVYLRLLALSEEINKLPLIKPLGETDDTWLNDEPVATETLWQKTKRGMMWVLYKFSHHLRVRDHDEAVAAVLPPENQLYLKQNMRLMLEQAQTALLREEAVVYETSLNKAQEWLKNYFPLNTQTVVAQAEIAELQDVIITQSLPNFSESSALLKEYIEKKRDAAVARRGGQQ